MRYAINAIARIAGEKDWKASFNACRVIDCARMNTSPMVIAMAVSIFTCFFIGFYCGCGYKKISENVTSIKSKAFYWV